MVNFGRTIYPKLSQQIFQASRRRTGYENENHAPESVKRGLRASFNPLTHTQPHTHTHMAKDKPMAQAR